MPNVMGFSMYYRYLKMGVPHWSMVENTLYKRGSGTWVEWFQDIRDRRDMSSYIRKRWVVNMW